MQKKGTKFLVIYLLIILIIAAFFIIRFYLTSEEYLEKQFLENIEVFERVADYVIVDGGYLDIDRMRNEAIIGYPQKVMKDINFILYTLNYRGMKVDVNGSVQIVKNSKNGEEKGLIKLKGDKIDPSIAYSKYLQDGWYIYGVINY